MPMKRWVGILGLAGAACSSDGAEDSAGSNGQSQYPRDDELHLNMLQAKATHNSYHVEPEGNAIPQWDYSHPPLDEQLRLQGVRGVELDTYYNDASDTFDVYHVPQFDAVSNCNVLVDCLAALRRWSDDNPAHHPIFVQIEPKSAFPVEAAEAHFERFEAEILAVWPRERIIIPDDVRGAAATLREAVTGAGWPTLGDVRGKLLFYWNEAGVLREAYTRGQQNLDGRLMFAEADPDDPYAAIIIMNTASAEVTPVVADGFIVRTRADSDGNEARANDTGPRDLAFASGAQIVSTDFPVPVAGFDYVVEVPGGTPSRCNPVTAPATCTSEDIENPAFID
jgi:hypothetical protein